LIGGLVHLVQRGGDWAGCDPAESHIVHIIMLPLARARAA